MSEMETQFQVGDTVQHVDGDVGRVMAVDVEGNRVRVQWERDGEQSNFIWNVSLVSRPQAETPEPRPFQVGDRVRHNKYEWDGTIISPHGRAHARVSFDGRGQLTSRIDNLTLIAPGPPVTVQDGVAVLPEPTTEPPCPCYVVRNGACTECGSTNFNYSSEFRGRRAGRPQQLRPYDEGGTNPIGLPTMPARKYEPLFEVKTTSRIGGVKLTKPVAAIRVEAPSFHECQRCGYAYATDETCTGCEHIHGANEANEQSFDAFLSAHECDQQEAEVPWFELGDIVEGSFVDDADVTSRGVVVDRDLNGDVCVQTAIGGTWWLAARRCRLITRKADR